MRLAESFARTAFARFINTAAGRAARVVVGLGMMAWGYTRRDTGLGVALLLIGVIPLIAGSFHLCIISALLGGPLKGDRVAGHDR